MRIDVVTIFPAYLAPLREALLGRALERRLIDLAVHDLRSWTHDVHQAVDDAPYGGGPGMVMRPQVWGEALDAVVAADPRPPRLVVPTPAGRPFTQDTARTWAAEAGLPSTPGSNRTTASAAQDSFSDGLLEGPSYTRPEIWRDRAVPAVLRSGNHAAIARWRRDRALERTAARRPELLDALPDDALDAADRALLAELVDEG